MKVGETNRFTNSVVLITGASSGIGKALALSLAAKNPRLVIVARRERKLRQTAYQLKKSKIKVLPIVADVRNRDDREKIIDKTMKIFGRIDVLVNNAGLGKVNLFIDQPEEEIDELIETNILSLIKMTKAVLPIMREQEKGHIINMSSTLALLPPYPFAVYSATKSAVKTFSDCLRDEVVNYGISVSTVLPGPYNTEFNKIAGMGAASFKGYNVEKLVNKIVSLIMKPKDVLVSPWFFAPMIWLATRSNFIMKKLTRWISLSLMEGKEETEFRKELERAIAKEEKPTIKVKAG